LDPNPHSRLIPHVPNGLIGHNDRRQDRGNDPGDHEERRKGSH
jgi:hypothetical protein